MLAQDDMMLLEAFYRYHCEVREERRSIVVIFEDFEGFGAHVVAELLYVLRCVWSVRILNTLSTPAQTTLAHPSLCPHLRHLDFSRSSSPLPLPFYPLPHQA